MSAALVHYGNILLHYDYILSEKQGFYVQKKLNKLMEIKKEKQTNDYKCPG